MASLKDRFLYGASGSRVPRPEKEPMPDGSMLLKRFAKNWGSLIQYNLVAAGFMLPAIAWSGINFILLYDRLTMRGLPGTELEKALPVLSLWLLVMIPLWGIADIGACGAAAVFRRIAEEKPLHHGQTFFGSIRENGMAAFLIGAGKGVLLWLLLAAEGMYAQMSAMPFRILLALGAAVLLLVLGADGLMPAALQGSRGARREALYQAVSNAIWHMPVCASVLMLTVVLPLAFLLIPRAGLFVWGIYELVIGLSVRQCGFVCVAELLGLGKTVPVEADDYD